MSEKEKLSEEIKILEEFKAAALAKLKVDFFFFFFFKRPRIDSFLFFQRARSRRWKEKSSKTTARPC